MLSLAVAFGFAALAWDAPAECPRREDIERDVQALAGAGTEAITADVRIRHLGPAWRLELTLADAPARVLVARSCDDLASAVAAILATRAMASVDPSPEPLPVLDDPSPPVRPSPPEAATALAIAPASLSPSERFDRAPARASSRERFAATASFGGLLGAPSASAAVRAGASFTPGMARFEVYGVWSLPRTLETAAESTKYGVAIAGARGCVTARRGPFSIAPCVGGEGGVVSSTRVAPNDFSYALSETERTPWIAATAGAILTARTGPVVLRLDLEVVVPTARTMGDANALDVRQAWAVVPRGFAGAELPIP